MIKLKFDNGRVEDYTIVLSTRDYRHLGQLTGLKSVSNSGNLNSADEISFSVTKHDFMKINGNTDIDIKLHKRIKEEIWKQIVDLKLIWVKEINEYFEIKVNLTDSAETFKTITATSLCEAELSQTNIDNTEINSEQDIARDDYEITVFYDETNPNASLLDRVFSKAPHYKIKYVDESLKRLQRTFSIDGTSIYDFLIGECSEQFNCLFVFDSTDRSISAYDLYTICNDCGERGDYYDICHECGSTNLKYFGEDTTIFVDKNNLTDSIQIETNVDSIKNCLKLVAGDELMTATIRTLNQNGSDYIYTITENQRKDMPEELVDKLDGYDELYNSYTEEYEQLVEDIYQLTDDILYLESGMMPTIENAEVTAQTEADKLTVENLSPLGLSSVTKATSVATANSALKNYAKVYIKTGYVKLETSSDSTFTYGGKVDGINYGTWNGRFIVTNYSDKEDVVTTDYLTITVYDDYEEFVRQKILKTLATEENEEGSIFDVLAIEDLDKFKEALTLYNLNRLTSFYDAIQGALDVLIQLDQATDYSELYEVLYVPYYNKLQAVQLELDIRQAEVDAKQAELDNKELRRKEIQDELNFEEYLGEYYKTFCAYRREQEYSNSNYISDGLDNVELIDRAKEFIETAKNELRKASENQYTISSTLKNFLVLEEFKPLVDSFKLGNWLRFRVDGELYKLRLIGYTINFDTIQNIEVVFSDITKVKNVAYNRKEIINAAKTMATSYGYVSKQAEKGSVAKSNIQDMIDNGLNTGLIQIKNNVNEDITWGKNGILCRAKDDVTGQYDPKQVKFTHNVIAFTDNNWASTQQIIGEHSYSYYDDENNQWESRSGYGITSAFSTAAQINGSNIVGGKIFSSNYSNGKNGKKAVGTIIDLIDGTFSFGGGELIYDGNDLIISSESLINSLKNIDITIDSLHIKAENINGYIADSQIDSISASKITGTLPLSKIEQITFSNITGNLSASRITGTNNDLISEVTADKITGTLPSSKIANSLSNKTITNSTFAGSLVTSDEATITTLTVTNINSVNNGTSYPGLTGDFTIGDKNIKVVNGLIVEINDVTGE